MRGAPTAHATANSAATTLMPLRYYGAAAPQHPLLDGRRLRGLRLCGGGRRAGGRAIRRERLHEGAPLEDHALVDLERRRVEVAFDAPRRVDLDRALRRDVADDG